MLQESANIGTIKHEVLYEVAKFAFASELQEKQDEIPFQIIPGPKAEFRCCVYKEREIIRQRVRLAQGKSPSANRDNTNIVQIINSACEGCPITRFVVTDNCQKCMSKKCQASCNFGAISMLRDRAYIDPNYCKECGKCAAACPYNAIADLMRPCKRSCPVDAITMDENNIVKILEDRCIHCGSCIKDCPFGAISDRSFMVDVIDVIREGDKPVYAMIAPAIEGQLGNNVSIGTLGMALKEIGFSGTYEVALGADLVAKSEGEEWAEAYKEGKKMTTSCCPAFVYMIRKHFPEVLDNMSTTVSPMTATSRLIKAIHPDAITVFIGPCIAKKCEVLDTVGQGGADYALTAEEMNAMFRARDVDITSWGHHMQQGSVYGKRFASAGGVTKAVIKSLEESGLATDFKVHQCNGAAECKKALLLLKMGRLPEDFMEGMACEGGCINGPGSIAVGPKINKNREELLAKMDRRTIHENIEQYEELNLSLHKK